MQTQHDILVNATIQATLIALLEEIKDGATVDEIREVLEGLLYYAQGGRTQ